MLRIKCQHGQTRAHPMWSSYELVKDGESEWVRCDRQDCDLEVVRPGVVQCSGEYNEKYPCGRTLEPTWCGEPNDIEQEIAWELAESYKRLIVAISAGVRPTDAAYDELKRYAVQGLP